MRWNLLLIVALLCYMLLLLGSCNQKDDPDSGMARNPKNSQSQNMDDVLGDE